MSAGEVETAPAPAPTGDSTDVERVETRETSGCYGCEPNGACEDYVSTDAITFPAYKNVRNKQCYNRDTMEQIIKYRGSDGFSRDPADRSRLNLPEDLANLNIERAMVVDEGEEEFDWTHWQQDLFPDDGSDMDEDEEVQDADDDIFDIYSIEQLIDDGHPEYAVAEYHTTKHLVKDFDTVMITRLWEMGMHVEAQELCARTIEMAPDEYSLSSIEDQKKAGMGDQAWQLHILKARWLPKGEYPVYMINHYLRMHMHGLAVSLHDRTISILYDEEHGVVYGGGKSLNVS